MSITPFDSALFGPLLSDPELARWLDDRAQLSFMLAVEGALARAEASVGVIPEAAAKVITEVADSLEIDPADLAEGTARERSEEHTSELQSLMRISYAVFCLKKKIET